MYSFVNKISSGIDRKVFATSQTRGWDKKGVFRVVLWVRVGTVRFQWVGTLERIN